MGTPIDNSMRWEFPPVQFPNEPGYWLWYILDMGYFNVGCVQVHVDTKKHLEYLRSDASDKKMFYIYSGGFENLGTYTMYHQAKDNLPPTDASGKPMVDGFIPFDFRSVGLVKQKPAELVPREAAV